MGEHNIFATLGGGGRVWAVGAIHGERDRLAALHAALGRRIAPGDKLVYLGNHLGHGSAVAETVDEMLLFRRALMARPGVDAADIVFLRGAQEEMWQKLLQLQFATGPVQVLDWMVEQGVEATLSAYGASARDGLLAAREGVLSLTRWTSRLAQAMRGRDGHPQLMSALRHAAFREDGTLLFVHAGIDPGRPLSAQSDSFWWGGGGFADIEAPYAGFRRVVRGYDRRHGGVAFTAFTATLDGGCGFGGTLAAACFDATGEVVETVQA